jgi:hypothetical protein|eukprot:COSAG01_NODE_4381_length_5082_cov_57.158539_7_plen_47_part_00
MTISYDTHVRCSHALSVSSFLRRKEYGKALKKFHAIDKVRSLYQIC